MAALPDTRRFAYVDGNPTAEENAVLAAIIASVRDEEDASAQVSKDGRRDESADAASGTTQEDEEASSSAQGLEDHRRCPICERRFDSRYVLSERRRLTTSGDSTLCLDTEYDRIYLHSTE